MGSHGSAHLNEAGLDEAADDDADDLEAVAPPDTSESQSRENIAPGAVVSPQVLTAEANQWLATGHMCRGRTMQRRHAEYSAMGQGFGTGAIKYVSTPDALAARLRPQHLCKLLPLMHTSLSSYTPMSCKGTGGGSGVRPHPGGHTLKEGRVRWFKPCARHTIRLPCPSATEPTLLHTHHRCVRSYPDKD